MDGNQHKFSSLALSIAMMLTATAASAVEENFDAVKPGTLPDEMSPEKARQFGKLKRTRRHPASLMS